MRLYRREIRQRHMCRHLRRRRARLDDLTQTSDFVYAVAVGMSLGLGLALGGCIPLVGTGIAVAGTILGRPGLGVLPLAVLTDAADDGVGAGGDD